MHIKTDFIYEIFSFLGESMSRPTVDLHVKRSNSCAGLCANAIALCKRARNHSWMVCVQRKRRQDQPMGLSKSRDGRLGLPGVPRSQLARGYRAQSAMRQAAQAPIRASFLPRSSAVRSCAMALRAAGTCGELMCVRLSPQMTRTARDTEMCSTKRLCLRVQLHLRRGQSYRTFWT